MAPRTSWKGFLKLSLVSVPVKAFTANNTSEEIRLNQLHKESSARIRYQKVTEVDGVVKNDDIVSGYEYAKDQYVVIDPDELGKLRQQSDRSVNIDGFVAADSVDPRFYAGKTYYLLPDGVAGERPYSLLHRGMAENSVHAIAQVIMSGREQLVLVKPLDKLLVMEILHFYKKIKSLDDFTKELEDIDTSKEEMALTNTLISASKIEDFDLSKYDDPYVGRLRKLIEMKIDGKEVVQTPDLEEPKIINLMEALKQSVAEAQSAPKRAPKKGPKKRAPKKMAPSAGKKKATRKKKSG